MKQISYYKKTMLLVSILLVIVSFKILIPNLQEITIQNNKLYDEIKVENTFVWSIITNEHADIYIQTVQRINKTSNKRDRGRYLGGFAVSIDYKQSVELQNLIYIRCLMALSVVLIFYKIIEYIYHKDGPRSKIPSSNIRSIKAI